MKVPHLNPGYVLDSAQFSTVEAFAFLAILAVVGLILGMPIVAFVRTRTLKKNAATREELRRLVERVHALEQSLKKLQQDLATAQTGKAAPAEPEVEPAPAAPAPVPKFQPAAETVRPAPPPLPAAPPMERKPLVPVAVEPHTHDVTEPPLVVAPRPSLNQPVMTSKPRRWANIEERLGANWLNKIGTAAFVIGVALFLNYSMRYLGAAGKIALGYALSALFIVAGVAGERRERYRIAARAVLGGGWALAYFTTYALHNVAAVRLVENDTLGFLLLFLVAAAMVAHSLRYQSELTTGFAYLLAFTSIAVSEILVGGLVASALLAASLVLVLRVRKWYALEPFAIVAVYAVHWLWLEQVYRRIGGHRLFPEFKTSIALLTVYWAIFLVSHFLRDDRGTQPRQILTASFLLNAAGYLVLLHHQSFHPEWRFWFLLGAGAVYLAVSALSWRAGRRLAFVLASTLGAALVVAAIPYRFSGARLELIWFAEAEALLIIGLRLADAHLRKLGWVAGGMLYAYVLVYDLSPRFAVWRPPNVNLGWLLAALAAAFYVNGQLKSRLGDKASETDTAAITLSPALATFFLLAAFWVGLPLMWVAVAWAISSTALSESGRRLDDRILHFCGHSAALLAAVRLLSINLHRSIAVRNVSLRLLTVAVSAALFYVSARRVAPSEERAATASGRNSSLLGTFERLGGIRTAYTATATLLLALLLWREVTTAAVALAWGLFGLALVESGEALRDPAVRGQGHILLLASFARIFFADLNAATRVGPFSSRFLTVTALAAVYYYAAHLAQEFPRRRTALLWCGTAALMALARFELDVAWVAVAWAGLAVALFALGRWLAVPTLRSQCCVLTLLVGVRCAFDNFYQTGPWRVTNLRVATVVAASALLYVLFTVARREKTARQKIREGQPPVPEEPAPPPRSRLRAAAGWIESHPVYDGAGSCQQKTGHTSIARRRGAESRAPCEAGRSS